jgi:hypothetical protein
MAIIRAKLEPYLGFLHAARARECKACEVSGNIKFDSCEGKKLLYEMDSLHSKMHSRARVYGTIQSILLSASFLLSTFAFDIYYRFSDIENIKLFMNGAIVAGIFILVLSFLLWLTTFKVDQIFWDRINDIEDNLGILGHKKIKEKLDKTWWYPIRRYCLWPALFISVFVFELFLIWFSNHVF